MNHVGSCEDRTLPPPPPASNASVWKSTAPTHKPKPPLLSSASIHGSAQVGVDGVNLVSATAGVSVSARVGGSATATGSIGTIWCSSSQGRAAGGLQDDKPFKLGRPKLKGDAGRCR